MGNRPVKFWKKSKTRKEILNQYNPADFMNTNDYPSIVIETSIIVGKKADINHGTDFCERSEIKNNETNNLVISNQIDNEFSSDNLPIVTTAISTTEGISLKISEEVFDEQVLDNSDDYLQPENHQSNVSHTELLNLRTVPLPLQISRTKVRALYKYVPQFPGDLGFKKGDFLLVSSDLGDSWWQAEHVLTKMSGLIPSNYVVVDDGSPKSLDSWFNIGRIESEMKLILPGYDEGTYILRPSCRSRRSFGLSVRVFDPVKQFYVVKHYIIHSLESGHFYITMRNKFTDIKSLISHYRRHIDGLCCRLKEPFPKTNRPTIQFRDIEVNRLCITMDKKIGGGHFGDVWIAKWNETVTVAVKTLKGNTSDLMHRKTFLDEARLLHKLHHPKIVELLGICSEPIESPVYIITEYMGKGALFDFIRGEEGKKLDLKDMLCIMTQVSEGMLYLESENFIHRDLRAANILVAEDVTVKVADFGLARVVEGTYGNTSGSQFPIRWTAPEAGLRNLFSIKSDIWSFGVLIYEIVTFGETPYSNLRLQDVLRETDCGVRLERPTGENVKCPQDLYNIMLSCWDASAEKRPTFSHLKDVFDNYQIYVEQKYELSN